jgi:hypothetical protein
MTNVTTLPLTKKICSRCNKEQPVANFDKDKSVKTTGLRSQCKTCRSELRQTYTRKPRAKRPSTPKVARKPVAASKPVVKPKPKYSPQEMLKQKANREAILRLINNHRAEFNSLVYSEQVRLGVITPGERRNVGDEPSWMSLA